MPGVIILSKALPTNWLGGTFWPWLNGALVNSFDKAYAPDKVKLKHARTGATANSIEITVTERLDNPDEVCQDIYRKVRQLSTFGKGDGFTVVLNSRGKNMRPISCTYPNPDHPEPLTWM